MNRLQNKSVFGILTIISEGNSFLYLPSFPCMVIVSSLEPAFIQPWFTGDTLHPCFLGKIVQEQFPLSNLPPKILLAYWQWESPVICHLVWQLIVKFLLFNWYHIVKFSLDFSETVNWESWMSDLCTVQYSILWILLYRDGSATKESVSRSLWLCLISLVLTFAGHSLTHTILVLYSLILTLSLLLSTSDAISVDTQLIN